jgi:hypothetical protein
MTWFRAGLMVTKVGDDYFPLPAQWDVTHRQWRP